MTNGGVGFNTNGEVDSDQVTGRYGKHDEVRGENFTDAGPGAEKKAIMQGHEIQESPFVHYVKREGSSGMPIPEQKHISYIEGGRYDEFSRKAIRNGYYFGETEADIFTWGLSEKPEIEKDEILKGTVAEINAAII